MEKEKNKYFWKFIRFITPKTNLDKLYDYMNSLYDDDNINYIKIDMAHLRLSNIYGVMLGRTNEDTYNLDMANLHLLIYEKLRKNIGDKE